jgi:hypothetical protein
LFLQAERWTDTHGETNRHYFENFPCENTTIAMDHHTKDYETYISHNNLLFLFVTFRYNYLNKEKLNNLCFATMDYYAQQTGKTGYKL